jgi:hypothetical protein
MTALDTEVREGVERETVEAVQALGGKYKYGWETEIEMEYAPKGVNEDIVRLISEKNGEPEWMTDWRLQAFKRWKQMEEPEWAMVNYPPIDYQDQYYYARPKSMQEKPKSLDEVDPKLLRTYEKLGIPLKEQMILAGVEGAEDANGRAQGRRRCGVRFRLGRHDLQGRAGEGRRDLLLDLRGDQGAPGAGEEIPRLGRADHRQLLRDAELGGLLGRVLRLRAAGRALPDGAEHLFPDQRREHRASSSAR